MPTDLDRLSDLANVASDLANRSNRLDDHADAAKAHYACWKASRAQGKEDRPSFGECHLRRAAEHDKIANEPDSYAQKNVLAQAADRRAEKSPSVEAFDAASKAHKAASDAWKKENPGPNSPRSGEAVNHDVQAKSFADQSAFLAGKKDEAGQSEASLEKKYGGGDASASAETPAASEEPAKEAVVVAKPAKKVNASFASASKG